MTNRVYYLSTCDTCKRILKQVDPQQILEWIDIKPNSVPLKELDFMAKALGSYEAMFSKRAQKYRAMGLDKQTLSESQIRDLIAKEYTFLKRPVFIIDEQVFAGNSKAVIAQVQEKLNT